MPVLNEKKDLCGLITQRTLTVNLVTKKLNLDSSIATAVQKDFSKFSSTDSLKFLTRAFLRYPYVAVVNNDSYYVCENKHLLDFILKHKI